MAFRPIVRVPALANQNLSALAVHYCRLNHEFLHIGAKFACRWDRDTARFILAPSSRLRAWVWNAPRILTVRTRVVAIGVWATHWVCRSRNRTDLPKYRQPTPKFVLKWVARGLGN